MNKLVGTMLYSVDFKRKIVFSLFLSLFLSVFSVLGFQLEDKHILTFCFSAIIIFCSYYVLYLILVYFLFCIFDRYSAKEKAIGIKEWYLILISFVIFFGGYFIILLGVFPGIFAFDSQTQFLMYENKMISAHHPVLHTLIMGYIIDGYSIRNNYNLGAFFYSLFQIVVMSLGFSVVSFYVYKKTKNYIIWIISVIFYVFFPPIQLQVLSATKDSIFLAFMLVTMVLSLVMIEYSKLFYSKKYLPFFWIISFVLMTIFRNNCIYAIIFLLVGLILAEKEHKKEKLIIFTVSVLVILSYNSIFVPLVTYKGVDDREKLSVPVQQLNRIYNSSNANISEDERIIIENVLGEGINHYCPKISDYSKKYMNIDYCNENKKDVVKTYFSVIMKNPKIAVESFLDNTYGFWYPYATLALYPDGQEGYWPVKCWEPWHFDSKIPLVLEYYKIFEDSDYLMHNPIYKTFFNPGSYFYLFLIMFGYSLYKKNRAYNVIYFFTFMLFATYLLGPVALVRYAIYFYAFVPLYFTMIENNQFRMKEVNT